MFSSVNGYVVWERNVVNEWKERGPAMINSKGEVCYICPKEKRIVVPEREIKLEKA